MIRLVCSDREGAIKLDFGQKFKERDAIRDVLNRLQSGNTAPLSVGGNPTLSTKPEAQQSAANVAPPVKLISAEERKWRDRLLVRKEVLKLHRKLVRAGAVSDDTFWSGMRYKYKPNGELRPAASRTGEEECEETGGVANSSTAKRTGERRGIPSDAFTTSGPDGALDISSWPNTIPTPAERHRAFMAFPAVRSAYTALIPGSMSEEKFWEYFRDSSMASKYMKNKSSRRSMATATAADTVFAEFQAMESNQLEEERRSRAANLDKQIDLDKFDDHRSIHVLEGHGDTGDAPRPLKRQRAGALAGSSNLDIMRQVNRHGQLIVDNTAMNASGRRKELQTQSWQPEEEDKGRPLEDLITDEEPRFAKLAVTTDMARPRAISKSAESGAKAPKGQAENEVLGEQAMNFASNLTAWKLNTSRLLRTIPSASTTTAELMAGMRP